MRTGSLPWQENWPIDIQLWQGSSRNPGDELDLSNPEDRLVTVRWRDLGSNELVLVSTELDPHPLVRIRPPATRGVVRVVLSRRQDWAVFRSDRRYQLEVIAYGVLRYSGPFEVGFPEMGSTIVNGVQVYASPREILELLGRIPGAVVETCLDLSTGWSRNSLGYWVRTLPPETTLYGLWIDDVSATPVPYEQLALTYRGYSRVVQGGTHYLFYNGPEVLNDPARPVYVETAFNRYVLRCLEEATAEFERRTGRFFNQRRIYREPHRGLYRQQQIAVLHPPVRVDEYFRLDAFTRTRTTWRRYTEEDLLPENRFYNEAAALHLHPQTGILTLSQNFWDWGDWRSDVAMFGVDNLAYLPKGENNIEITYTGGYEKPPADVAEAVANMAAIRQGIFWQQAITQGMQGISIGCVSLNFGQMFGQWFPNWQSAADRIIEAYQRVDLEAF